MDLVGWTSAGWVSIKVSGKDLLVRLAPLNPISVGNGCSITPEKRDYAL